MTKSSNLSRLRNEIGVNLMLKRKLYQKLLDWKQTKNCECLLIKGARQVGKTFLVREFGRTEYEYFVELNLLKNPEYKEIFDGNLSAEEIYKKLTLFVPSVKLVEGNTLIFIDEIQKCPKARTALKFLAEDNRFDIIASGSLLGLHYGKLDDKDEEEAFSIPVGYENQMIMYSLDFEEFLWAYGFDSTVIDTLKVLFVNREYIPEAINEKYQSILREYIVVGGMPEVVNSFVTCHDFEKVHKIQKKILASYDDDIINYAKGIEKIKVKACYDTLPSQLAKENKKFKYSEIEKKATARKYGDSIEWLKDANLICVCHNTFEPYLPLIANEKSNEFKAYVNDTGLLMARYGRETKLALLSKKLKGNAKGGIYENLISEILVKNGYELHYYKKNDSQMEIEFLIEKDGAVVPVEVKAGNTSTASLNSYIKDFNPPIAYKIADSNIGITENKITIPHYLAMFI